jgi:GDP/UDP-N,N'-diacetylbacillosamine 2-epimerase (hydrolysing)
LCCPADAAAIESAIRRAMTEEFRSFAARESSPFGDGHTSEKILPVLLGFLESSDKSLKKPFYDLSFEV